MTTRESEVAERLVKYAAVIVKNLGLRGDHNRESARGDLVLAGLQVFQETGDIGKAKHRMSSRAPNVYRRLEHRKHEISGSDMPPAIKGGAEPDERAGTGGPDGMGELQDTRKSKRSQDVVFAVAVNEFRRNLTDQQRHVLDLREACLNREEIAAELGLSVSAIARLIAEVKELARAHLPGTEGRF